MTGNREYKSDVFSMLMEKLENALCLYNAMNDSNYTDPDMVELCTLDRGISLTVHNDAAFAHPMEQPEVELVCTVYNINYGKDRELLAKCPFLKEYMIFVDYVRENHRINGYENLEHSIEMAIDRCIEEDVLRDFLIQHRSEVVKVVKLDYTFDRQLMLEREDSREEGRAEGLQEGREVGREEGRQQGRAEGRAEGKAEGPIICCKNMGKSREETVDYLIENLDVTKEEAERLLTCYWDE